MSGINIVFHATESGLLQIVGRECKKRSQSGTVICFDRDVKFRIELVMKKIELKNLPKPY